MHNRWCHWGLFVALSLALAACNAAPPPPRSTVSFFSDKFHKGVTLNGIPRSIEDPDQAISWMIQTLVDPETGITDHGILVHWVYGGRSNGKYEAHDDTARRLPVRILDKDYCPFNSCDRTDKIDVGIDEAMLRARATTGFQIKIESQAEAWVVMNITPEMIAAQLEAMEKVLAGKPSRNTAATGGPPVLNLPFNPNAPGAQASAAPSFKDAGIGIGYMPMLMSKIRPGASNGLMVSSLAKGSPADLAGIKLGDILISFNGRSLTDVMTAAEAFKTAADEAIAKATQKPDIPVQFQRGDKRMTTTIHL